MSAARSGRIHGVRQNGNNSELYLAALVLLRGKKTKRRKANLCVLWHIQASHFWHILQLTRRDSLWFRQESINGMVLVEVR